MKFFDISQASLEDTPNVGNLVSLAKTLDQAKAVLSFLDAISEKTLRSTVALTAARGRGKSAAIGLCLAGAVSYGYSNIFVTAPSPENLKTVFQFIISGLKALKYTEHLDFEVRALQLIEKYINYFDNVIYCLSVINCIAEMRSLIVIFLIYNNVGNIIIIYTVITIIITIVITGMEFYFTYYYCYYCYYYWYWYGG